VRPLHDRVPDRRARDAVVRPSATAINSWEYFAIEYWFFGLACVSKSGNGLIGPPHFGQIGSHKPFGQPLRLATVRKHFAVLRALVPAFPIDKLAAGHDHFAHRQLLRTINSYSNAVPTEFTWKC
jgi:hypothetical protein